MVSEGTTQATGKGLSSAYLLRGNQVDMPLIDLSARVSNFAKLACSRQRKVADKDLYECQQACVEGNVDIKTGIVPAEIDLAVPDNKPPALELARR